MVASDADKIRNLLAHCSRMLDTRQFHDWADTFTEDGSFNNTRGRAALVASMSEGTLAKNPELKRVHSIVNSEIAVDGDSATCVSDLIMYEKWATDDPWTMQVARYDDVLTRSADGEWRFASRRFAWFT
jgi:3-phenylpropionate/cinnamic acid dioxygenase small subunit